MRGGGVVGGTKSPAKADSPPMTTPSPAPARPGRPRPRRRGIGPAATMGLVLFGVLVVGGLVGAGVALATYASISSDLPLPEAAGEDPAAGAVGHLRPHRQGRARPVRRVQPRGRQVRRDPAGARRRHDGDRGRVRSGTTRASTRSASSSAGARLDPRRAARRLDDHPAARPPAAARPGPRRRTELSVERKIKEIIQSIRVTAGLSRASRASSGSWPPTSTRTIYGNESYGVAAAAKGYFGVDD